MSGLTTKRIELPTGVTLNVQLGGDEAGIPVLLLHGFPESHRTWRAVAPALAAEHFVVAPDQRGFAGSDKPEVVEAYRTDRIVEDIAALADVLGLERFALAGHDWGGAVAWLAALRLPERIEKLVIVNAPHPLIFQRSLIEDRPQRAASQYINALRNSGIAQGIRAMGLETFFAKTFSTHAEPGAIAEEEKAAYLEEWGQPGALEAMTNWYRASEMVVPKTDEETELPAWTLLPFPKIAMPTLVIWGMKDTALLPVQLEGLDELVPDLRIVCVADAGHFVPWERPEPVIAAMRDFLAA